MVKGLSGCAAEDIVRVEAAEVIEALGLAASLTPSRNNGFLNMFRLMQKKSLAFVGAQVRRLCFLRLSWQHPRESHLMVMPAPHMHAVCRV